MGDVVLGTGGGGGYSPPPDNPDGTLPDDGGATNFTVDDGTLSNLTPNPTDTSGGGITPYVDPGGTTPATPSTPSSILPSFIPQTIAGYPTTTVLLAVAVLVGAYFVFEKKRGR
jgi:hypothetical protein